MKIINIDELTTPAKKDLLDVDYIVVEEEVEVVNKESFLIKTYYTEFNNKKILHGQRNYTDKEKKLVLEILGSNNGVSFHPCYILQRKAIYKTNDYCFQIIEDNEVIEYSQEEIIEKAKKLLTEDLGLGKPTRDNRVPIYNCRLNIKPVKGSSPKPEVVNSVEIIYLSTAEYKVITEDGITVYFKIEMTQSDARIVDIHL